MHDRVLYTSNVTIVDCQKWWFNLSLIRANGWLKWRLVEFISCLACVKNECQLQMSWHELSCLFPFDASLEWTEYISSIMIKLDGYKICRVMPLFNVHLRLLVVLENIYLILDVSWRLRAPTLWMLRVNWYSFHRNRYHIEANKNSQAAMNKCK